MVPGLAMMTSRSRPHFRLCGFELHLPPSNDLERPMTEENKTRAPKNSKPLGAGEAFDLIMARVDTRGEAIANFAREWDRRQAELEKHTFARVPENQRERLERMIKEEMRARVNAADPAPPADDGIPDALPPGAQPLDPAREENIRRMTGAKR